MYLVGLVGLYCPCLENIGLTLICSFKARPRFSKQGQYRVHVNVHTWPYLNVLKVVILTPEWNQNTWLCVSNLIFLWKLDVRLWKLKVTTAFNLFKKNKEVIKDRPSMLLGATFYNNNTFPIFYGKSVQNLPFGKTFFYDHAKQNINSITNMYE